MAITEYFKFTVRQHVSKRQILAQIVLIKGEILLLLCQFCERGKLW